MLYVKTREATPYQFEGLEVRELITGLLPAASVAHVEVQPGAAHGASKSTKNDKLYICISGAPTFEVDGNRIDLVPLDLLVVQRDEWFNYRNESADTAVLFLIHVPPYDSDGDEFLPAETAA